MPTAPRVTRSGTTTTISFSGPFFEYDPGNTFRANVRLMLAAMAAEGVADVQSQMPVLTGATRANVVGRVKSVSGMPWLATAVISEAPDDATAKAIFPWRKHGQRGFEGRGEAIYRGGKLEASRHMFRLTKNRLGRSRHMNVDELLRGIA